MIAYSRPKRSDLYTLCQSKLLENHTLHSGTYLYSPYMAVPPPPPSSFPHSGISTHRLTRTRIAVSVLEIISLFGKLVPSVFASILVPDPHVCAQTGATNSPTNVGIKSRALHTEWEQGRVNFFYCVFLNEFFFMKYGLFMHLLFRIWWYLWNYS